MSIRSGKVSDFWTSASTELYESASTKSTLRALVDNRYVRPLTILFGLMLIASSYSNWQPMFLLLNNMGAYGWICTDESSHESDFAICDEQYDYMSQIYSVAVNSAYLIGLLAGILMDTIGGRSTMAIGLAFCYSGWIMLVFSNEETPLYWPGLIFLGCAENLLGYPGFLVAEFWPEIRDNCVSLSVAMQMLSSWIPMLSWYLVENHQAMIGTARDVIICYLAITVLPSILMLIATPGHKSAIIIAKKQADEIAAGRVGETKMTTKEKLMSKEYWASFSHLVFSFDFILFCFWYALLTLGFGFYNVKVMEFLGSDVGKFIGLLNPTRAIIAPIMGIGSDCVGAFPILIIDNIFLIAAFGLALIPNQGAGYASAVFYILGRSFCFTTKYIYVQNFYPKEHFGKLAGIISFVGGMFGFMNVWFQVLPYDDYDEFIFGGSLSLTILIIPVYFLIKTKNNKTPSIVLTQPSGSSVILRSISGDSVSMIFEL